MDASERVYRKGTSMMGGVDKEHDFSSILVNRLWGTRVHCEQNGQKGRLNRIKTKVSRSMDQCFVKEDKKEGVEFGDAKCDLFSINSVVWGGWRGGDMTGNKERLPGYGTEKTLEH